MMMIGHTPSPVPETQPSPTPGSKSVADGAQYRPPLTPPKQQISPPLPQLSPPMTKAGEMPFISDRTFPLPATSSTPAQWTTGVVVAETSHGVTAARPCTCPSPRLVTFVCRQHTQTHTHTHTIRYDTIRYEILF